MSSHWAVTLRFSHQGELQRLDVAVQTRQPDHLRMHGHEIREGRVGLFEGSLPLPADKRRKGGKRPLRFCGVRSHDRLHLVHLPVLRLADVRSLEAVNREDGIEGPVGKPCRPGIRPVRLTGLGRFRQRRTEFFNRREPLRLRQACRFQVRVLDGQREQLLVDLSEIPPAGAEIAQQLLLPVRSLPGDERLQFLKIAIDAARRLPRQVRVGLRFLVGDGHDGAFLVFDRFEAGSSASGARFPPSSPRRQRRSRIARPARRTPDRTGTAMPPIRYKTPAPGRRPISFAWKRYSPVCFAAFRRPSPHRLSGICHPLII